MTDLVRSATEHVNVSENVQAIQGLYFELTEPVSIGGIKQNSDHIKLEFDTTNPNLLIGFRIMVNLQEEDQTMEAYREAFRLTSLLTLKRGRFVFHKRPKTIVQDQITGSEHSFTTDVYITNLRNLDMTDNEVSSFLSNDSKINQQVAHFANGQKALDDGNYVEAIRELYQVIENENLAYLDKFRILRNGISHSELIPNGETVTRLLSEFNISAIENPHSMSNPKGKYVDITDPNIQKILGVEAKNFREKVIRFIDAELNIIMN